MKRLLLFALLFSTLAVAKSNHVIGDSNWDRQAKHQKHVMADYNLTGMLYKYADTSDMWHTGDGKYVCTDSTPYRGPDCYEAFTLILFKLADGRSGFFHYITDDRATYEGNAYQIANPLEYMPEFYDCTRIEIRCMTNQLIHYREENGHIFVPYWALVKKGLILKEAEYAILLIPGGLPSMTR